MPASWSRNVLVVPWVSPCSTWRRGMTWAGIQHLHFGRDRERERCLLDRVLKHTRPGGHVFLFVHSTRAKKQHLDTYLGSVEDSWEIVVDRRINYVYEETQSGFRSTSRFRMVVLRAQQGERTR